MRQHAIPYTVRQVSTGSQLHSFVNQSDLGLPCRVFDLELNDTVFVVWVNGRRITRTTGTRIDPGKEQPNPDNNDLPLLFHTVDHHRRSLVGQIVTITKCLCQRQFTDRSLFNLVFQHFSELRLPPGADNSIQLHPQLHTFGRSGAWRTIQ